MGRGQPKLNQRTPTTPGTRVSAPELSSPGALAGLVTWDGIPGSVTPQLQPSPLAPEPSRSPSMRVEGRA